MTVRVDEIQTVNWQTKRGELGAVVLDVDDVNQCIATIIKTPRGSCPHRPDFGSDVYLSIDKPINVAAPAMIRDAHQALAMWEPRLTVERVVPVINTDGIELTVYWRPAGSLATALTNNTKVRL